MLRNPFQPFMASLRYKRVATTDDRAVRKLRKRDRATKARNRATGFTEKPRSKLASLWFGIGLLVYSSIYYYHKWATADTRTAAQKMAKQPQDEWRSQYPCTAQPAGGEPPADGVLWFRSAAGADTTATTAAAAAMAAAEAPSTAESAAAAPRAHHRPNRTQEAAAEGEGLDTITALAAAAYNAFATSAAAAAAADVGDAGALDGAVARATADVHIAWRITAHRSGMRLPSPSNSHRHVPLLPPGHTDLRGTSNGASGGDGIGGGSDGALGASSAAVAARKAAAEADTATAGGAAVSGFHIVFRDSAIAYAMLLGHMSPDMRISVSPQALAEGHSPTQAALLLAYDPANDGGAAAKARSREARTRAEAAAAVAEARWQAEQKANADLATATAARAALVVPSVIVEVGADGSSTASGTAAASAAAPSVEEKSAMAEEATAVAAARQAAASARAAEARAVTALAVATAAAVESGAQTKRLGDRRAAKLPAKLSCRLGALGRWHRSGADKGVNGEIAGADGPGGLHGTSVLLADPRQGSLGASAALFVPFWGARPYHAPTLIANATKDNEAALELALRFAADLRARECRLAYDSADDTVVDAHAPPPGAAGAGLPAELTAELHFGMWCERHTEDGALPVERVIAAPVAVSPGVSPRSSARTQAAGDQVGIQAAVELSSVRGWAVPALVFDGFGQGGAAARWAGWDAATRASYVVRGDNNEEDNDHALSTQAGTMGLGDSRPTLDLNKFTNSSSDAERRPPASLAAVAKSVLSCARWLRTNLPTREFTLVLSPGEYR